MATADAPTPIPGRASDADRRKIARLLQEHSTQGRLSRDTFAMRVERALTARSRAELDDLVADVREPGPLRRAAIAAVGWVSRLTADIESAWRAGRTPVLALPEHPARPVRSDARPIATTATSRSRPSPGATRSCAASTRPGRCVTSDRATARA